MRTKARAMLAVFIVAVMSSMSAAGGQTTPVSIDVVQALIGRLSLEAYKSSIKGLTQFGDRLQGTDRNRAAIDWIEAQLKEYGCAPERFNYVYNPPPPVTPTTVAARRDPVIATGEVRAGQGGSRLRGIAQPTAPSSGPLAQTDVRLRQLNSQVTNPGPRQEVYCTKVGATLPQEMYLVSAHMDGRGFGEAANDNGSGTALVMELARVLDSPDVQTDRSVRFILWNNEETALDGARAYVEARAGLQGKEDPVGSRRFPEPRWLGMIQHDMMLFDHGMRRADGSISAEQRPEADVNIEFQATSRFADEAMRLAFFFRAANEKYATDYPAAVGSHMTNTDSTPFMDFTPSISLRENERGMQIGAGWDPHWHQPTDRYDTFSDKDFRLGLNAAQTTLAAVAQLVNASLRR
ncbi:MAG: M20/M25/M40 family metallo-hydrolase [Acidobacteriota bacterium]